MERMKTNLSKKVIDAKSQIVLILYLADEDQENKLTKSCNKVCKEF